MYITMFLIGLLCGTVTGLLSIGGGIILIFFFLLLLPLISETRYTMQTITGFSMMQTFFSTLSGGLYYFRSNLVDRFIVLIMGIPAFGGSILGSLLATNTSELLLRIIFALVALFAAIMMLVPYNDTNSFKRFHFTPISITFTIILCIFIGVIGGLVGLGAGFLFMPIMIFIFKLPIKKAIGSSLITAFLLSTGSMLTKLSIGAIPLLYGLVLVIGGVIGAQIGSRIAKRLKPITLKRIAAYAILLVSVRMFYDLFK